VIFFVKSKTKKAKVESKGCSKAKKKGSQKWNQL